jgi:hypothetical protein
MQERLRPQFPLGTPSAYQALAEACWQDDWMGRWVPPGRWFYGCCDSFTASARLRLADTCALAVAVAVATVSKRGHSQEVHATT